MDMIQTITELWKRNRSRKSLFYWTSLRIDPNSPLSELFLEHLKLMKEALTHQPYLDWILACISISKPKVILTKLLHSGFGVFVKNDSSDAKREHLRALTCILEYLGLFPNFLLAMYLTFRRIEFSESLMNPYFRGIEKTIKMLEIMKHRKVDKKPELVGSCLLKILGSDPNSQLLKSLYILEVLR